MHHYHMTLGHVSLKLANKAAGRGAQPKHRPNLGHLPLVGRPGFDSLVGSGQKTLKVDIHNFSA